MTMANEWLMYVLVVAMALGSLFVLLGYVFGLIVIPSLFERDAQKYTALIASILVPPLAMVICFMNYRRTRYACHFMVLGVLCLVVVSACVAAGGGWPWAQHG